MRRPRRYLPIQSPAGATPAGLFFLSRQSENPVIPEKRRGGGPKPPAPGCVLEQAG